MDGLLTAGLTYGDGDSLNRVGGGIGNLGNGCSITLGLIDDGLLLSIRAGNEGLPLARCNIDLLLTTTL